MMDPTVTLWTCIFRMVAAFCLGVTVTMMAAKADANGVSSPDWGMLWFMLIIWLYHAVSSFVFKSAP